LILRVSSAALVCSAAAATDGLRSSASAARVVWALQVPLWSSGRGARIALLQEWNNVPRIFGTFIHVNWF